MRHEPQIVWDNVTLVAATVVQRRDDQHSGMVNTSLDGMGGMIMVDLALLFHQRLNWHADNLLVYLEYVDDVVVALSGNSSDDSK